jgi:hypothetical protein
VAILETLNSLTEIKMNKIFDMKINEQSLCNKCNEVSNPFIYSTNIWYVSAADILSKKSIFLHNFEQIFRSISNSEIKECSNKNCKSKCNVIKYLTDLPNIITIGN